MKKSGFSLIELLMASVILAVLATIAIPNFTRAQRRAKEAEVKSVAHVLQMAVEDYKTTPTWLGKKPSNAPEFTYLCTSFLPNNVQIKMNPFNAGGRFIVGGPPTGIGEVGYEFSSQATPYTVSCMGGTQGVIILTLVEEQ